MVFDMGSSNTKLYLVERGIVQSSHTVNRGSQDITLALSRALGVPPGRAEEIKRGGAFRDTIHGRAISDIIPLTLEYVFTESNRILLHYQKMTEQTVQKVVFIGGGVLLPGFLDMARSKFETEVAFGDPFGKVRAPAFLEDMLRAAGPEFSVAVGIALRQLMSG
jgi:cell division ATPase FtsA